MDVEQKNIVWNSGWCRTEESRRKKTDESVKLTLAPWSLYLSLSPYPTSVYYEERPSVYIQQSTRTLRYSLSFNHPQWQPRVVLSLPHVIEIVNKMLKMPLWSWTKCVLFLDDYMDWWWDLLCGVLLAPHRNNECPVRDSVSIVTICYGGVRDCDRVTDTTVNGLPCELGMLWPCWSDF